MKENEKINEKILRIVRSGVLEKDIDFGGDVLITLRCGLERIELKDNHDGSYDKIFKVGIIQVEKCEKAD